MIPQGLGIYLTNAGFLDTPAWEWRELARTSDRWHFQKVTEQAPWLDEAEIAEARRRNPPARYRRLWEGVWGSSTGDLINPADIDAACTLDGPQLNFDHGWEPYVGALDLGINHDHSALVVMSLDMKRRRYRLVNCESWKPPIPG